MFADRLRIGRLGDRQHFFQQIDYFLEWNQGGPLGLQIETLWTVARPLQPGRARTECVRGPSVWHGQRSPPRVRHLDRSEHGIDRMRASFLAAISLAAVRTHALMLQLLDHLLGGHKVLYPMQNRLAFGYAYPQGLHGPFRPLQFRPPAPHV